MVRQAHHDRGKTVRPELVEGCQFGQWVRLPVLRKLALTPSPNLNRLPNPYPDRGPFSWFEGALRAWGISYKTA